MADYNSIYTGEEIDAAVGNAKSAADLKTAYESNADTNGFTDAEQAKLANQSGVNTGDQDISGIATNASDILALESEQITQNSAIALNTAKRTYPLVDENKLAGIESGADVTDVTNVTAAGAVMTDSNANLDSLQLNGGVSAEGTFAWNDADGTVDLNLKGGNVTLQIGQEEVVRIVNGTGVNLLESEYRAVKVIGAQGQRLQVDFALADSDVNSVTTIGVVTESILNNQEGFITTNGIVRGVNTTGSLQGETWVDGDVLYLSPTIEGTLTNIKPTTPAHLIVIGYVVYSHITQGKIFVKVDNGYELEELHDVLITSISDNELLQYNSAEGYWENQTLSEAGIQPAGNYILSDIEGVLGADLVTNIISLTQAEYDAIGTPNASTIYNITDAPPPTGLQAVVDDTTPQLGGSLDTQGNSITGNYPTDGHRVSIIESTTARTLSLTDAGDRILFQNIAASTCTIPANASVAFPNDTEIDLVDMTDGLLTIVADTGVTLNGVSVGSTSTTAKYAGATLIKIATDNWLVFGKINDVA